MLRTSQVKDARTFISDFYKQTDDCRMGVLLSVTFSDINVDR